MDLTLHRGIEVSAETMRRYLHQPGWVLLKYARAADVSMDVLVDDELDLPEKLPAPAKYKMGVCVLPTKHKEK